MTYKQLLNLLQNFTPEALEQTVTVYDLEGDEYTPIVAVKYCNDGVLDDGHPFLEEA